MLLELQPNKKCNNEQWSAIMYQLHLQLFMKHNNAIISLFFK